MKVFCKFINAFESYFLSVFEISFKDSYIFLVSSYSTKEEVSLRRNGQRYKFTNIPGRTKNTIDVEKHPLNTVGHHEILNESCEPKLTFFKIT